MSIKIALNKIDRIQAKIKERDEEIICLISARAEQRDEINHLREIIDRAAKAWMSLNSPPAWEGDVADAMAEGVAEIERLKSVLTEADTAMFEANAEIERMRFNADFALHSISPWQRNCDYRAEEDIRTACRHLEAALAGKDCAKESAQ